MSELKASTLLTAYDQKGTTTRWELLSKSFGRLLGNIERNLSRGTSNTAGD